jgi:hypothetical protein
VVEILLLRTRTVLAACAGMSRLHPIKWPLLLMLLVNSR